MPPRRPAARRRSRLAETAAGRWCIARALGRAAALEAERGPRPRRSTEHSNCREAFERASQDPPRKWWGNSVFLPPCRFFPNVCTAPPCSRLAPHHFGAFASLIRVVCTTHADVGKATI